MHYVRTATITTVVAASHSFALRTAVSRAIRTHRQELVLNRDYIAKYGSTLSPDICSYSYKTVWNNMLIGTYRVGIYEYHFM